MSTTLVFVAKSVDTALGAQVRVSAGLEFIIVATGCTRCIKVTWWAWCVIAWATVVELTWRACALALWAIAAFTRRAVTKLGTVTIAGRTIAIAVTTHMAAWTWCAGFCPPTLAATTAAAIATAASGFGVANALHHFAASRFGCRSHHVTAWGLADTAPQGLTTHGNGLGLFVCIGAEAFDDNDWHLLFGEDFDVAHEALFIQRHQAHCLAARTRTTCAADAVYIVFADVRDFIVHHVWQLIDVDTACSNVSGHQGANVAALEASQGLRAGSLALVAVQCHGADAVFGQKLSHVVGAKLGACEHQNLAPIVFIDDVCQQSLFLAAAHGMNRLRDALHSGVAGRDLDALRVFQQVASQFANFVAEGRREQQALFVFGHQGQDLLDVMDKAHVQHAVGFVEHQDFHGGQVEQALLLQVEQAAWGGHQNVHAFFNAGHLGVHAHAAKDDGGGELQVFAVATDRLFHLRSELTGGGQDQGAHAVDAKFVFFAAAHGELVQQGQCERRCFTGAGLGACQQVMARENGGDSLGLDGGGSFVTLFEYGF